MNYRRKYDPTPLCSGGSRGVTSHLTPMARQPISCYYYALKQFIAVNIRCHVTRRLCAACVRECVCGVLLFYPLLISFRFLVRTWGICPPPRRTSAASPENYRHGYLIPDPTQKKAPFAKEINIQQMTRHV